MSESKSKRIAGLFKHSSVYVIGSAVTAAGGLLLLPLYTNTLAVGEYGTYEILNKIADIMILVAFMGTRQAYIRHYFENEDVEWKKTVTSTGLHFSLISSLFIVLIFYPLTFIANDQLFNGKSSDLLFYLLLSWIPFEMVFNIGMATLQVQMRSTLYVTISIIKAVLFITFNYIALVIYDYNVEGILSSQLIISSSMALVFYIKLSSWAGIKISKDVLISMLKFGLPYLPAAFFMYIITSADRYFLSKYGGLEEVGIYALAAKIGMISVLLVMEPFNKIWSPFIFENCTKDDGPVIIAKVFAIFVIITTFLALAISTSSYYILPLISADEYQQSIEVVPLVCLASLLYGMACLADAGILISKKTKYKPLIFSIAAFVAVVANYLLVPNYGIVGAAISSVLVFFSLLVVNTLFSNRFYRISYEYARLAKIIFIGVSTYCIFFIIVDDNENIVVQVAASIFSCGLYGFLLVILRVINRDEIRSVRNLIKVKRS